MSEVRAPIGRSRSLATLSCSALLAAHLAALTPADPAAAQGLLLSAWRAALDQERPPSPSGHAADKNATEEIYTDYDTIDADPPPWEGLWSAIEIMDAPSQDGMTLRIDGSRFIATVSCPQVFEVGGLAEIDDIEIALRPNMETMSAAAAACENNLAVDAFFTAIAFAQWVNVSEREMLMMGPDGEMLVILSR